MKNAKTIEIVDNRADYDKTSGFAYVNSDGETVEYSYVKAPEIKPAEPGYIEKTVIYGNDKEDGVDFFMTAVNGIYASFDSVSDGIQTAITELIEKNLEYRSVSHARAYILKRGKKR